MGRKAHPESLIKKGEANASHLTGFLLKTFGNDGVGCTVGTAYSKINF